MTPHEHLCPECGASLKEHHSLRHDEEHASHHEGLYKCTNPQCKFFKSVQERHDRYMEDIGWNEF